MHDDNYESFNNDELKLEVRAVFVRNALMEMEDGEQEIDAYFWFAGPNGYDFWFGFGISDTCEDNDPDVMLENSDENDLKRLALYLGDEWDTIMTTCPHCVAKRHRYELEIMPAEILKQLRMADLDEILQIRQNEDWNSLVRRTHEMSGGLILSQN